ncbi:hypothetical protein PSM7751_01410 [Pseudooceanicola marinus]|uniref:Phage head-tail joining protein n=1 Tax=Pseudooceanicola marinus TaxID=396013 RepID=A0A1X6YX28_9RHOB|nr:head-tail adaptor protein [Pseudooceanicola marinus]PJE32667.1 hypothetical protein CVM50_07170 [Pseudooceanicola marinus]SLN34186.1 hypothetical protein PSM7751_01410 [Pseudooceanicola marinus]
MAQTQGAPLSRGKELLIRDRLVTFERRAETGRNALNEPTFTWAEIGRSWGAVENLGAQEQVALQTEGMVAAVRVLVLDTPLARSVSLVDRIRVLGETWDLVGRGPHAVRRGIFAFTAARASPGVAP